MSGVPVVLPSKTPERIWTLSASLRFVVISDWPGLRRSSCFWISSSPRGTPGVTPSTITPTPRPCDSPNVVTLNMLPKVLPGIGTLRAPAHRPRS